MTGGIGRRLRRLRSLTAIVGTAGTAVALGSVVGLAPAQAAPTAPTAPTTPGTARQSGPNAELRVQELTPKDLAPGQQATEITIRGTVANTGTEPLTSVQVRLHRGSLINTRSELHQSDDDTAAFAPVSTCEWSALALPGRSGALAPGQTAPFQYRCPIDQLSMSLIGIYPLALRAQATTASDPTFTLVGETHTYLPSFPDGVTAKTRVSWLWPLVDRPHRLSDEAEFVDDDLATSVSPGGRLDRLLSAAEKAKGDVRLTLAVDPALIDDLHQMEQGYRVGASAGRHGPAARAWLDRLAALASKNPVMVLPYADPDLVALKRTGMADLASTTPDDAKIVTDRLGHPEVTGLAWPTGGALTQEALDTLLRQGTSAVVLAPEALPGQPVTGPTPSSVAALHDTNNSHAVALVPDPDVATTVSGGEERGGGPRLTEQRYLAELAMITAEAPSRGRDILVAPPRRWNPDPATAAAMLSDTAGMSWLSSGSAAELAHHQPQVDRGPLVYPEPAHEAELPKTQTDTLARLRSWINDFGTAFVDETTADRLMGPYDRALQRAASSAWRDDQDAGRRFTASLDQQIAKMRSGVHIVKPSGSGVYNLASSNSPLFLTVANDLDDPVRIKLRITSRGTPGFTTTDIGEQVIQARTRRTIQVPTTVQRSGLFVVDALLTTPGGQPLGDGGEPVQLKVRSTAYGIIGLVITGSAMVLFLLLAIRRLVLRARRRANAPVAAATDPGAGTGTPGELGAGPDGHDDQEDRGGPVGGVTDEEPGDGAAPRDAAAEAVNLGTAIHTPGVWTTAERSNV